MKTRRHIFGGLTLAAAALVCLTGCKKDDEGEKVVLGADFEQTAGMQKTYVGNGDKTIYWNTKDSVWVNDKKYTVNEGAVEVKLANSYYAVYPATAGNSVGESGGEVVIPATQEYLIDENTGVQRLDAPMAARLDSKTGRLLFRNLYAVIKVTVQATDAPFTLKSITVESTNDLAGTQEFSFNGKPTNEAAPTLGDLTNGSKSVTLTFAKDTTIPANGSADFYLYLLPYTPKDITIKLNGNQKDSKDRTTFTTKVERSCLGSTTVDVSALEMEIGIGKFLVGTTEDGKPKYVTFSSGNLQWSATNGGSELTTHAVAGDGTAAGTWRFAEHQYDYIGSANSSISSSYNGWIDLFGWGTSGYNEKYPYMTSTTDGDYGNGTNDIAGNDYDWGVYNAIYNPKTGKTDNPGTWRTLTKDEWVYLIQTRTKASDLCKYGVTVCGKSNCLIIAPDGFTGTIETLYDASAWSAAEAAGLVCLPAAGFRLGSSFMVFFSSNGDYWSSTYGNSDGAYTLYFRSDELNPSSITGRYGAQSVRLVKDVE